MIFPYITHIDQLKEKVGHMKEIRFVKQDNGYTVVCYMISDENTFHGKNAKWVRECRGITFYPNGQIAARPMHKFFNIGECDETRAENLEWLNIISVNDKRDGSMLHPVLVNGETRFKSKKSFTSDVAKYANEFVQKNKGYIAFSEELLYNNKTPIFEFTAPNSRIVINYGPKPQMKLLHIRDNFTGEYIPKEEYEGWIKFFDIDVIETISGNPQELFKNLEVSKGIEGYIFQFANGNMVKAKTSWYLELHHSVTFPTYRSLAEMVLNETIDDYKSYLTQVGASHNVVNKIEHQIVTELNEIEVEIEKLYELNKHLERKEVAITNKDHPYFSLLMQKYLGKEPDVKKFYTSNYLKERFSNEQIGE